MLDRFVVLKLEMDSTHFVQRVYHGQWLGMARADQLHSAIDLFIHFISLEIGRGFDFFSVVSLNKLLFM